MAVNLGIWTAVLVFSFLLMLFVKEALALTLMFSSLNAIVASLFGIELVFTACVFLISYCVLLSAIVITNACVKLVYKNGCVDNAQKNKEK